MKLGHVGMGTGTVAPFDQVYDEEVYITSLKDLDDLDAVVIWGGADISPTLYGEEPTKNCCAGVTLSRRDEVEAAVVKEAVNRKIPVIGVCRGAQLLCAVAGGKLVQDVHYHCETHNITTDDGRTIKTSSVHHQMMYPFNMDESKYKMIAWADRPRSANHYEGVTVAPPVEPEIIYFPEIKGLAIQGHPEFMDAQCEFVQYCNDLVKEYLVNGQRNS